MNRRPTTRHVRKRNRRNRPALRYEVQVHETYWRDLYPEWDRLSASDQGEKMNALCKQLHAFLCTRRPKGSCSIMVTTNGKMAMKAMKWDDPITIRPLDDRIAERVVMTEMQTTTT